MLGFYRGMPTVYFSVALIVLLGGWRLQRVSTMRVGAAAIVSSVLFFAITNFGMWLFSGIYPRTLAGFEACYVAAIPFFQNTLAGDLFFSRPAVRRLRAARTAGAGVRERAGAATRRGCNLKALPLGARDTCGRWSETSC